ncbi:MAG: GIY-YIG nuclease family protein [Bacteroidales bacterium]
MFFVYVLESLSTGRYYIGQTSDLEIRVKRHNAGRNKSTKSGIPWKVKCWQEFKSRSEAVQMEQHLKRLKKRTAIIDFITKNNFRGVAQSG